jgi:hypothetical protein
MTVTDGCMFLAGTCFGAFVVWVWCAISAWRDW